MADLPDNAANATGADAADKYAAQYVKLMKRALSNAKVDFIRANSARWETEYPLDDPIDAGGGDLADEQAAKAFEAVDSSLTAERYSVAVGNALLYDALTRLDETKRTVVLMAFGLDIPDAEIGGDLNIGRRRVNRIGKSGLEELRKILEGAGFHV